MKHYPTGLMALTLFSISGCATTESAQPQPAPTLPEIAPKIATPPSIAPSVNTLAAVPKITSTTPQRKNYSPTSKECQQTLAALNSQDSALLQTFEISAKKGILGQRIERNLLNKARGSILSFPGDAKSHEMLSFLLKPQPKPKVTLNCENLMAKLTLTASYDETRTFLSGKQTPATITAPAKTVTLETPINKSMGHTNSASLQLKDLLMDSIKKQANARSSDSPYSQTFSNVTVISLSITFSSS